MGERVVVRRRRDLPPDAPAGEPRHTDVLGHVVEIDDDGVTLRTRHGDVVHVPADVIALGKRVPPPPAPRTRRHREDDRPDA